MRRRDDRTTCEKWKPLFRLRKESDVVTKFEKNFTCSNRTLTQDFFCVARRRLSEGGSVQKVHDRLSEQRNAARRKKDKSGGHSSAGRAPALHAGGRRFDPAWLHQITLLFQIKVMKLIGVRPQLNCESGHEKFFRINCGLTPINFCSLTIWKFLTS